MPVFVCGPERLGGSSPSHRENCRADAPRFSARAPSPRLRAQSLDHKWQRHLVPAHLSHGDLDDVGEHVAIEDSRDGIAHVEHQHSQTAVRLVGAGAAFVGRHAHARDRRERAVDEADDVAEADFFERLREKVAAGLAAFRVDVARAFELVENLFEELHRQPFLLGDLADFQQRSPEFLRDAEVDHRTKRIFTAFGKFHGARRGISRPTRWTSAASGGHPFRFLPDRKCRA